MRKSRNEVSSVEQTQWIPSTSKGCLRLLVPFLALVTIVFEILVMPRTYSSMPDFAPTPEIPSILNSTTIDTPTPELSSPQPELSSERLSNHTSIPEKAKPVVDIITIGSHKEFDHLAAQWDAFGRHPATRNFRFFTELDDDERDCATRIDASTVTFISNFCRGQKTSHDELTRFRSLFARTQWLAKKGDAVRGWLCAQKRPAESLYKVLKSYANSIQIQTPPEKMEEIRQVRSRMRSNQTITKDDSQSFPDYLFLLDADTYLDMNKIMGSSQNDGLLPTKYPAHDTTVIAGCRVKQIVHVHNFTFPWGGFGTFFTRRSIERFLHPIHNCDLHDSQVDPLVDNEINQLLKTLHHRDLTNDEFERLVCSKLKEDTVGEASLFKSGMTVADLMYAYVTNWKYVNSQTEWKTNAVSIYGNRTTGGFCFHADWVIGYFVNHYYLSSHDYIEY